MSNSMLRTHLYRSLLKLGKKFDKNPRYKALIFSHEARFSDENFDQIGLEISIKHPIDQAMKAFTDQLISNGTFYKPEASLTDLVRDSFRKPLSIDLNENEKNQLGFMAIKQLYDCERIANEMSSVKLNSPALEQTAQIEGQEIVASAAAPSSITNQTTDSPLLTTANKLTEGVLLVTHPMRVQFPFTNSVILLSHVTEDHSTGIVLNKQFRDDFKALLARPDRIRYGFYLKEFFECACFNGGDGEFDAPLNFCILHQQDALAGVSRRVNLAPDAAAALETVFNEGNAVVAGEESSSVSSAGQREVDTNTTTPVAVDVAGSGSAQKNYVYISHNFQAVAKELVNGTVSKQDIKIVRGALHWTDGELEKEIATNAMFAVHPVASVSPSTVEEAGQLVGQQRSLSVDMVMAQPMPLTYTMDVTETGRWTDPTHWVHGQYTWAKALCFMGGEYQDMARLNRLNNSERAGVVVDLLRNVVGYGQRTFTDDSDSDSDSDFSMSDIDGALVFDENGGEILVSAAMVDALSEELGEDIDFDEFSSDDDDE